MSSVSSISSTLGGTYGLSGSGIDVDSLVKKLMAGQQSVEDTLTQKQTVLQWKKAAYNTVNDDLLNFRTNTVFNYKLQATLTPNKVTSSNTSVATVTVNAAAADVTHSLIVSRLASGVNLTSSQAITASGSTSSDTLASQMGLTSTDPFEFTISNGDLSKTISIDPSTDSINDVVSAINNAGVNVTANYDSTLDRMFLSTTNTGGTAGITMSSSSTSSSDPAADFIAKLNLFSSAPTVSTTTSDGTTTTTKTYTSASGTDAEFSLDNTDLTESNNTFTISGVTYNLMGVSPTDTNGTAIATSIGVANDVDAAVANVQSFVDAYNKMLDELNSKVDEARYTDYPPLTSSQKADMSDSDVELWNEKAKSGMLYNDSTLTGLINTMRSAISTPIAGIAATNVNGKSVTYNSLASIGITTSDYTEGGKLHFNSDTLKTALQANPNVLNQLFATPGTKTTTTTTVNGQTKTTTTTDFSTQGIEGRLYDAITNATDQLTKTAGTTSNASYDSTSDLAVEISDYTDRISNAKDKYNTMQSQYYTQYNAMEVALQQLSAQSSWLASMLDSST